MLIDKLLGMEFESYEEALGAFKYATRRNTPTETEAALLRARVRPSRPYHHVISFDVDISDQLEKFPCLASANVDRTVRFLNTNDGKFIPLFSSGDFFVLPHNPDMRSSAVGALSQLSMVDRRKYVRTLTGALNDIAALASPPEEKPTAGETQDQLKACYEAGDAKVVRDPYAFRGAGGYRRI